MDSADRIGFAFIATILLAFVGWLAIPWAVGRFGACVEMRVPSGECEHPRHRLALEPGAMVCRCEGGR